MHALGHPYSFVLLYTACNSTHHINIHLSIGQFRGVIVSTNQIFRIDQLVRLFIAGNRDKVVYEIHSESNISFQQFYNILQCSSFSTFAYDYEYIDVLV